ncbi:MAG: hypothetical protein NC120_03740 [Ruminococcus sp.]|nr:hypothetical protein [Ruminococcus sp.]
MNSPRKIIDFHTHILPAFDDGPKTCEESAQILARLFEQNVTHAVSTSHFYRYDEDIPAFLDRRDRAFEKLYAYLDENNIKDIPQIIPGAEVYFSTALIDDPDLEKLCIQGTDYILIELPYQTITKNIADSFKSLACCGRVRPILAHIERYGAFAESENALTELLEAAPGQINCGSLVSSPVSRLALKLIKGGYIAAIGTDTHNLTTRPPRFAEARKKLSRRMGSGVFTEIMESEERILNNI